MDSIETTIRDLSTTAKLPDKETWGVLELLNRQHYCVRCGKCCTNQMVGLLGKEIIAIARFLSIPASEFKEKYIERQVGKWLMLRRRDDDTCPFLIREDGRAKCSIYEVRPETCRRFPWLSPSVLLDSTQSCLVVDNDICPQMSTTFDRVKKVAIAVRSGEPAPPEYDSMGGGTD